jgi:hypothetical protein
MTDALRSKRGKSTSTIVALFTVWVFRWRIVSRDRAPAVVVASATRVRAHQLPRENRTI